MVKLAVALVAVMLVPHLVQAQEREPMPTLGENPTPQGKGKNVALRIQIGFDSAELTAIEDCQREAERADNLDLCQNG